MECLNFCRIAFILVRMKNLLLPICLFFLFGCKKNGDDLSTLNQPQEGDVYLSLFSANDNFGRIWHLDKNGNTLKDIATPGIAMNLQQWNINGTKRYTYLEEDKSGYHIPGFTSYIPGYQVIADENMNEIKRVHLSSYGAIDASTQKLLDAHDFILLSDDHYITMAYYLKTVTNIPASLNPASTVMVIAPIIQEVENNQVIWQWDGTDYPELYAESVEGNNFSNNTAKKDYLHINSMVIDESDSNLVCSFRNANLILKLNRTTGNIIWKLGGQNSDFPMMPDQVFLRQHNATFIDNGSTLLLFDNGEQNERPYSRVLELGLNQTTKQITSFKSFDIPASLSVAMGSVQKRGNTYFICGGTANYIMEINFLTGIKTFEMALTKASYRAFKY